MSTPSPEKDNLLGLMVHKKIAYQIFKKEGFFWITLYIGLAVLAVVVVGFGFTDSDLRRLMNPSPNPNPMNILNP